jgi:hypothetical protein
MSIASSKTQSLVALALAVTFSAAAPVVTGCGAGTSSSSNAVDAGGDAVPAVPDAGLAADAYPGEGGSVYCTLGEAGNEANDGGPQCNALDPCAAPAHINARGLTGAPPTSPTGGVLLDGVYFQTEDDLYSFLDAGVSDGAGYRSTTTEHVILMVSNGTVQGASVIPGQSRSSSNASYTTQSNALTSTATCPANNAGLTQTIGYTATATSLTLYFSPGFDEMDVIIYAKQ